MDRNIIIKRLDRLAKLQNGRLTPDAVVQDARSESSPLHGYFEWDDTEAARKYRLEQARELIRSVTVEVSTDQRVISTVNYVRDPSAGDAQGYVSIVTLSKDKSQALLAMQNEVASIQGRFERASDIADVLGITDEFRSLCEHLLRFREKLKEVG